MHVYIYIVGCVNLRCEREWGINVLGVVIKLMAEHMRVGGRVIT